MIKDKVLEKVALEYGREWCENEIPEEQVEAFKWIAEKAISLTLEEFVKLIDEEKRKYQETMTTKENLIYLACQVNALEDLKAKLISKSIYPHFGKSS